MVAAQSFQYGLLPPGKSETSFCSMGGSRTFQTASTCKRSNARCVVTITILSKKGIFSNEENNGGSSAKPQLTSQLKETFGQGGRFWAGHRQAVVVCSSERFLAGGERQQQQ